MKKEEEKNPHIKMFLDAFSNAKVGESKEITGLEDGDVQLKDPKEVKKAQMVELAEKLNKAAAKIERDAFLYMDPKEPHDTHAQCGTCMMFTGDSCTILGKNIKIAAEDSCGLYVPGKPMPEEKGHEMESLTPKEAGLVHGNVRCENCTYAGGAETTCQLFKTLNERLPNLFDLDEEIKPKGCCNAFIPGVKSKSK